MVNLPIHRAKILLNCGSNSNSSTDAAFSESLSTDSVALRPLTRGYNFVKIARQRSNPMPKRKCSPMTESKHVPFIMLCSSMVRDGQSQKGDI